MDLQNLITTYFEDEVLGAGDLDEALDRLIFAEKILVTEAVRFALLAALKTPIDPSLENVTDKYFEILVERLSNEVGEFLMERSLEMVGTEENNEGTL